MHTRCDMGKRGGKQDAALEGENKKKKKKKKKRD
jgi:hypothetical protein